MQYEQETKALPALDDATLPLKEKLKDVGGAKFERKKIDKIYEFKRGEVGALSLVRHDEITISKIIKNF